MVHTRPNVSRARPSLPLRAVLITTLALVAGSVGWLAWRVVDSFRDPEEPLWTEADAPSPPTTGNAWFILRDDIPSESFDHADFEHLVAPLEIEQPVSVRIAAWRADREQLLEIEARHADEYLAADEILESPRLVDACSFAMEDREDCPAFAVVNVSYWWAFEQMARAHRGELPLALHTARRALDAFLELRGSARSNLRFILAHLAAVLTGAVLELLVGLVPPDQAVPEAAALRARFESLPAMDPEPGLRGDYVSERRAIDHLIADTRIRTNFWAVHPRACTEAHNAFYRQLVEHIRDPSVAPPVIPEIGDETPWYINNWLCDALLVSFFLDQSNVIRQARIDEARMRELAARIVGTLDERAALRGE